MSTFLRMSKFCNARKLQESFLNYRLEGEMHRNAAVLTIVCVMMCLTVNYTFPLHRKSSTDSITEYYPNQTQECDIPTHHKTIVDRSKKMASNLENAFKRIKDSTQDLSKNIYDHVSSGLKGHINIMTDEDLRQYEQMVIMKKYPYLDLKELELKYSPTKNARQSAKFDNNVNTANDPGFFESLEDSPNVEIISRGLTGFAMPPEMSKPVGIAERKSKFNTIDDNKDELLLKLSKKSSIEQLRHLKNDIEHYVEKKM